MKTLLALALICFSLLAHADNVCGGKCLNTTSHSFMNTVCADAEVEGATKCGQFGFMGCAWKEFTKRNVRASICANGTKDRTRDLKCTAASASGDRACLKTPGCVWIPAAYTCQR